MFTTFDWLFLLKHVLFVRMPSALAPLKLMSVAKSIPVLGYLISWTGILEEKRRGQKLKLVVQLGGGKKSCGIQMFLH